MKKQQVINDLFLILDRSQYQLGSLSHMIDAKAAGYQELPDFPEEQPDPTVRNVEVFFQCLSKLCMRAYNTSY